MPFSVNVKWNDQKFKAVELDTATDPLVFKSVLFSLTGVDPTRQKVLLKGTMLKDDCPWDAQPQFTAKLKDKATLMMMGTVGDAPAAPTEKMIFVEDMDDKQKGALLNQFPGLPNKGNTCYLNSTLQCMFGVKELRDALMAFSANPPLGGSAEVAFAASVGRLFKTMSENPDPASVDSGVLGVVTMMYRIEPSFAERDERGAPMQQDASECWTSITRALGQALPGGVMDKFFRIDVRKSLTCVAAPEEKDVKNETVFTLGCHINQEVKHMLTGIMDDFDGLSLVKRSQTTGADAEFQGQTRITRLPKFLPITLVRFEWKQKEQKKAKILREVSIPLNLDVLKLCSDDLREKIEPARARFKAANDDPRSKIFSESSANAATQDYEPTEIEGDEGSNNSGYYELIAVLTHKGLSANSGHYIGWKRAGVNDWIKYDDDKITHKTDADIQKLAGGTPHSDISYICLYESKQCPIFPPTSPVIKKDGEAAAEASGDGDAAPMEGVETS